MTTSPVFGGALAKLFAPGAVIGLQNGDYSVKQTEYQRGLAFTVTGVSGSGRSVTVSPIAKVSYWRGDASNLYPCFIKCGSERIQLDPGQVIALATDGSSNGIMATETGAAVGNLDGWQAVAQNHTAVSGEHLDFDTSAGALTLTLPADPEQFDEVFISNLLGTFATHPLNIARNGETIMGLAEDMSVNTDFAGFVLRYSGTDWRIV